MLFTSGERPVVMIIAALVVLDSLLIVLKGVDIDLAGYVVPVLIGALVIAGGQFYRQVRRDPAIAMALTAAGLFILFTLAGSIFNYMLLPLRFPLIDSYLVRFDAMMGYHWPSAVEFVSRWPAFGNVLKFVYFSSLPQLVAVILVLGFTGADRALAHFLLTGVFGAMICVVFWSFFPSFGPSSLYDIPASVTDVMPLGVSPEYGAELLRLGREGVSYLTPENILGLIGFPSFHTVMACMSVVFLVRYRWLFAPALLLNTVMLPAILVHGGHHLSDLLAGFATFAIAYALSAAILRNSDDAVGACAAERVWVQPE